MILDKKDNLLIKTEALNSLLTIIHKVKSDEILKMLESNICEVVESFNFPSSTITINEAKDLKDLKMYFRLLNEAFELSNNDNFPVKLISSSIKIFVKKIISLNALSLYNEKHEKENIILSEIYAFFIQNTVNMCRCLQVTNEQQAYDELVLHIEGLYKIFKIDKIDKDSLNSNMEKIKEALFKSLAGVIFLLFNRKVTEYIPVENQNKNVLPKFFDAIKVFKNLGPFQILIREIIVDNLDSLVQTQESIENVTINLNIE